MRIAILSLLLVGCSTTAMQSVSPQQAAVEQQRLDPEQSARRQAAVLATHNNEPTIQLPPAANEKPVKLVCTSLDFPGSATLVLYERNGRAGFTINGVTRWRRAHFTRGSVSWTTPTSRFSLNRLDGTFVLIGGAIPGREGLQSYGTCIVAEGRF